MKTSLFALLLFILIPATGIAQVLPPDADTTYYAEMWNIYNSHKRLTYLAYPFMDVNGKPGFPVLFEANLSPYFLFYRGRDNTRRQLRSFEVYFNPEICFRMYHEDPIGTPTRSLPVRPINFAPRLSAIKFLHSNNVVNLKSTDLKRYQFLELSIAHYSNGQQDPHYLRDTIGPANDSIPNYTSGNFSTNFVRLAYTTGGAWGPDKNPRMISATPYLQADGGIGDLFGYEDAQINSYGKWRMGGVFQLQTGRVFIFKTRTKKGFVPLTEDKSVKLKPQYPVDNYYATFLIKFNPEFIIDDVHRYPGKSKTIASYRLSVIYHPLNWRNLGFLAEFYSGRDYYNIRFYDKITQFKIGLVANPNFYLPRYTY